MASRVQNEHPQDAATRLAAMVGAFPLPFQPPPIQPIRPEMNLTAAEFEMLREIGRRLSRRRGVLGSLFG